MCVHLLQADVCLVRLGLERGRSTSVHEQVREIMLTPSEVVLGGVRGAPQP